MFDITLLVIVFKAAENYMLLTYCNLSSEFWIPTPL